LEAEMTTWRAVTLVGATITMGLVSGVFALYAHTIMPGLKKTDDHTFVAAFQAMDRAIVNPWFMLSAFVGALLFPIAAVIANRGTSALPWIGVALGLYVIAFVVTIAVNVPLNNALMAAGDPDHIKDLAVVRERFHEGRWVAWNLVRVLTSVTAFGCLAWALVLYGRGTA
jgi:uncharacterized membrane protein